MLPDDVQRLLHERDAARASRDFDRADALRDELRQLGWEVQDSARGSSARPALPDAPAATGYARAQDLASRLDEPAAVDSSLQIVVTSHADDLRRFLRGLAAHQPASSWELVVVANAPDFDLAALLDDEAATLPVRPDLLLTSARLGWADAVNLGLRRSLGQATIVLDTSLEPEGDFVTPLVGVLGQPGVGIAGGWGVTSDNGRHFAAAPAGEVDAIEAYCLAIRREALREVGGFDPHFRFYRNADLDLSFDVRSRGWRAMAVADLPLSQHAHRGWNELPDAERDRLSKRNFYRFLKRWGDRRDLLLNPRPR
ncbi:MAG TPA: glycosyltransferase [Candidatus Limnocylindria bacterium]|nr:glycosyltransferase [Candidatus Limnocylindria bacterium]